MRSQGGVQRDVMLQLLWDHGIFFKVPQCYDFIVRSRWLGHWEIQMHGIRYHENDEFVDLS